MTFSRNIITTLIISAAMLFGSLSSFATAQAQPKTKPAVSIQAKAPSAHASGWGIFISIGKIIWKGTKKAWSGITGTADAHNTACSYSKRYKRHVGHCS